MKYLCAVPISHQRSFTGWQTFADEAQLAAPGSCSASERYSVDPVVLLRKGYVDAASSFPDAGVTFEAVTEEGQRDCHEHLSLAIPSLQMAKRRHSEITFA